MLMELCKCGTLETYLEQYIDNQNPVTREFVMTIFSQIAEACLYVHFDKRYIHRDMKTSNILVAERLPYLKIKLCDFGFARAIDVNMMTYIGTAIVAHPDILQRKNYDDRSDLFSIGCILYFILHAQYPASDCYNIREVVEKYKSAKVEVASKFKEDPAFVDIIDLIEKLLSFDVDSISWEQFREHPFVVDSLKHLNQLRENEKK